MGSIHETFNHKNTQLQQDARKKRWFGQNIVCVCYNKTLTYLTDNN